MLCCSRRAHWLLSLNFVVVSTFKIATALLSGLKQNLRRHMFTDIFIAFSALVIALLGTLSHDLSRGWKWVPPLLPALPFWLGLRRL